MSTPAKLTKTTLFFEGGQLIGQGEITLPNIQFMMQEFNSFGTSGTVEIPMRSLQAMESAVKVGAPNARFFASALNVNSSFRLQARAAFQVVDPISGSSIVAERVELLLMPKTFDMGARNQSEGGEFNGTFSVLSVAYFSDGVEVMFADPINNIYRVNGVDLFAADRVALGL
jgi:uncharacterized protein